MVIRRAAVLMGLVLSWSAVGGCRSTGLPEATVGAGAEMTVVTERWPNGQTRMRKEVRAAPDGTTVDNGRCELWYDNGQPEYRAVFVDGKVDGAELQWHRNGQLRTQTNYERGLRQGVRHIWDEQGRKRKEEFYDRDEPCGVWTIWKKDGSIEWQGRFDQKQ